MQYFEYSNINNQESFCVDNDSHVIKTPFNMEMILRACPDLRKKWEEKPFYFDLSEGGDVVCIYI